jgi:uncharacterized cupredoxin-like copper-binding protein
MRTSIAATLAAAIALLLASTTAAATKATTVTVSAGKPSEFRFTISKKSVKLGAVTFKVTNHGSIPHDFKLCTTARSTLANSCTGKTTAVLQPGKTATLTFTFKKKGTYEYLCTVSGHAAAGMKGSLKLT